MLSSYQRHSPSALNLFAAQPSMFVLEKVLGLKQPVGVPAHRGSAVEDGVAHGLRDPDAPLKDCNDIAFAKYDMLTAVSGDQRKARYRQDIPYMVERALEELRPYGIPTATQGYVEWLPAQLVLPIIGYFDFRWDGVMEWADGAKVASPAGSIIVDLKTSERMPSSIKIGHARQVALYTADGSQGRICYVTPKKSDVFRLEESQRHLEALISIAESVEAFLSLSDDPEFFTRITTPDLDSFYWGDPAARELAYKYWRV